MLKGKKQIIFTINEDEKGFTLSTKLKGEIKMDYFRAVASYTNSKYNEYATQINKINRETKRANYKKRG